MNEKEFKKMIDVLDTQLEKSIKVVYLPHILLFEDSIVHLN